MESVHAIHKQNPVGWFSALFNVVTRMRRRSAARSRGFVVTPWSGRSPAGWSA
jgi:hypothetical protein